MVLFKMKFWTYLQGGMVYFDNLFDMYNIANTFQEQIIRSVNGEGALEKDIEFLYLNKQILQNSFPTPRKHEGWAIWTFGEDIRLTWHFLYKYRERLG